MKLCALVRLAVVGFCLCVSWMVLPAQSSHETLTEHAADSAIVRWPDGNLFGTRGAKWEYDTGTLLMGMDAVWYETASPKYFDYVKRSVDILMDKDGNIPSYKSSENTLDNILMGRQLLLLYRVTEDKKYYKAATQLRQQFRQQPRTQAGTFWHKQIYPSQMWLDGLYMAEPFYAEYAQTFHETVDYDDIARQFVVMEKHVRDPKTGLLYHAWDETKQQKWANKQTGASQIFWSRGMGWYAMALVDTLGYIPKDNPHYTELLLILNRLAAAIVKYQDPKSGLWWQVTDKPNADKNYLESSGSCMFVYALAKGARLGYLPASYQGAARHGYSGIVKEFIHTDADGTVHLTKTVGAVGLGGSPTYRDGTYNYYVSAEVKSDEAKGVGAFLLASSEADFFPTALQGRGDVALLDAYYNSQKHADVTGQQVYYHYKWNDLAASGFSFFAHAFHRYGVKTETLYAAPTAENLAKAQIYIIASPDIPSKNPKPNFMTAQDADAIVAWVKNGGVLVMLENDGQSSEFEHINPLMKRFGIHYNPVVKNQVTGRQFEMGQVPAPADGTLFLHSHKLYMKEISTITTNKHAQLLLTLRGDGVMAMAKFGKGTVYANVDPWLYNEYTDGRKLPPDYDNFAGGLELVRWLVEQVPAMKN